MPHNNKVKCIVENSYVKNYIVYEKTLYLYTTLNVLLIKHDYQ